MQVALPTGRPSDIGIQTKGGAFDLFIKDLDEVKVGVIQSLAAFLGALSPTSRLHYLPVLSEIRAETDNWRFRHLLASQLAAFGAVYPRSAALDTLLPLALSLCTDSVAEVTSTINQTIWGMWDSIPGQDEVNAGVYNTLNDTMLGLGHAIWGNWLDSNEEVLEAAVTTGVCEHIFCRGCLEDHCAQASKPSECVCPLCRKPLVNDESGRVEASAAALVRANMKKLRGECHCGARMPLSRLRDHLRACGPNAHLYPPRRKFGHEFRQPSFVGGGASVPSVDLAAEEEAALQAAILASLEG